MEARAVLGVEHAEVEPEAYLHRLSEARLDQAVAAGDPFETQQEDDRLLVGASPAIDGHLVFVIATVTSNLRFPCILKHRAKPPLNEKNANVQIGATRKKAECNPH